MGVWSSSPGCPRRQSVVVRSLAVDANGEYLVADDGRPNVVALGDEFLEEVRLRAQLSQRNALRHYARGEEQLLALADGHAPAHQRLADDTTRMGVHEVHHRGAVVCDERLRDVEPDFPGRAQLQRLRLGDAVAVGMIDPEDIERPPDTQQGLPSFGPRPAQRPAAVGRSRRRAEPDAGTRSR